jgi:anaerobic magnesium-protoporphyrin IX monomethyl ester cyclase
MEREAQGPVPRAVKPLLLFVRPPRPLWPFNGPGSAFWPPLAFASLAAAVRASRLDVEVRILDAPALEMGWRSLERELARLRPVWIGLGEEAVSCVEGLRLAGVARRLGVRVIAGGCFFGHVAPEALRTGLIDVVVHGEGEETLVELMAVLRDGDAAGLRQVRGISFLDGEEVVRTRPRALIRDLDRLPFPAYDLLPVERYGRTSRHHPALAAVEAGRGCPHSCEFCVLWRQMGHSRDGQPVPHHRSKSPERLREELRILRDCFGRRYVGWVDPCFNADPDVPRRLAESLLRAGRPIGQSAWVRADCLVRDAASGALETCVRGGLNEVYIGIERLEPGQLRRLRKGGPDSAAREALDLLARRHPAVFTVGTFLYGLPEDTPRGVRALFLAATELPLDLAFFIPLTPLPGTAYWRPELWDASGESFRSFGFLPHVDGDPFLARLTTALHRSALLAWTPERLRQTVRRLLARDPRRRDICRRQLARLAPFVAWGVLGRGLGGRRGGGMRFPAWYAS